MSNNMTAFVKVRLSQNIDHNSSPKIILIGRYNVQYGDELSQMRLGCGNTWREADNRVHFNISPSMF